MPELTRTLVLILLLAVSGANAADGVAHGLVRYEMISLTGDNTRPDLSLFAPPGEYEE